MEKPLLEMKRFGRHIHQLVQKNAKKRGIEFMGGPQGQVLHIVSHRGEEGQMTLIKDIEEELDISKSVASNLIKRMEKNGLIRLEVSPKDKRAKYIHLTPSSKEKMKDIRDFFDAIDRSMLEGISKEELTIFFKVMEKFYHNVTRLENGGENAEISETLDR